MGKAQGLKCVRNKRNGDPCPNWAVHGSLVCNVHGGKLENVKAAAAERKALAQEQIIERLKQMAEPAMAAIERVMNDENAKSADVLKASEMILSRLVGTKIETSEAQQDEVDLDADIEEAITELAARRAEEAS